MGNGCNPTGIVWTSDGMFRYISTCYAVMRLMATLDWGEGYFNGILIPSLRQDPRISDQRQIVIKDGLHRGPRLGRPAATVLLDLCLDLLA